MKRSSASLMVAVATLACTLFQAPAASGAEGDAALRITGDIFVYDDDGWFMSPGAHDENKTLVSESMVVPVGQTRSVLLQGCAGGEVRAEYTLSAENLGGGRVRTQVRGLLYEGVNPNADCPGTTDLDGAVDYREQVVSSGRTIHDEVRVDNQDEGGDWARLTVDIAYQ